ncbi:MAG: hypothetical protein ACYTEN_03515 [Planctomycetota bacterium]|jgi:hypothetical protein
MNDLIQSQNSGTNHWFKSVLLAGMLLFAFYASTHMVAAGDTWVAMACGRHFDNHGVDTVEPFSFNSHHAGPTEEDIQKWPGWAQTLCKPFSLKTIQKWHPTGWINQNWLTHLIFYKLASWFGEDGSYNYNTLVYWKFGIYFLAVICVYATGKLLGAGDFLSAAGACFAMVIGRTFYDIRPSGYSNLLVPVFILLLALAVYKNYRLIWLIVPLIVFWANVHGGYLYAFIMLVPFVGIHLLLRLPRRWSLCLGFVGLWLVMYLMSYKFISNTNYLKIQELLGKPDSVPVLFKDKILIIWAILAVISVILTVQKSVQSPLFYAYHIGVGIIYFLSLAPRFFLAEIPSRLSPHFKEIYSHFVFSSQITFLFVAIIGCLLILALALKKERFVALSAKGIYHTVAAGIVSFVAMIVFNPFHLTNLTHTFEISVSKHAESWRQVNEWKPAFDWMDKTSTKPNPVGSEEAFAVLCVLTGITMLFWLIGHFLKPRPTTKGNRKKQRDQTPVDGFQWPKIDLAILIISLLSMYMAIRSRRFIAIAGSAAAPAVFLMLLQGWQMFSARFSWKTEGPLRPILWPPAVLKTVRIGTLFVVLSFGAFWGMKYKRIYLDPWPTDARYHSVFMRMTASHLKPFEVCDFISDNDIRGRVFNYWTEGGAIAFGQTPDTETGKTPLKLFMDGRAQAAYNHETFRLWQLIYSGGPVVQQAQIKGKKITSEILKESGQWIDTQLKERDVWVVLMPQTQSNSTFMRALKQLDNWKTAYIDDTQHLLVDTDTPQGKALIERVLADAAVFPDAFSKQLTTATVIIETKDSNRFKELYDLVSGALEEQLSPAAASTLALISGIPTFREKVADLFQQYLDGLQKNKEAYRKTDGFRLRLNSAIIAARFLARVRPDAGEYMDQAKQFENELEQISAEGIW